MSTSLPRDLREQLLVHERAALGPRTTLGVGGEAPWLIELRRREELLLAVRELTAAGIPFRMLGHGSNLLVSDAGVPEVVLHTRHMQNVYHHGEVDHALRCEAGAPLARLVSVCHGSGLTGAECLIGIPGTVGGAVVGNAGGRHGSIGDLLTEVTVVEADGSVRAVPCSPEAFGYRRSPFRGAVVVDAVVQLAPAPPPAILERMTRYLKEKSESQPLGVASAGCVFRNSPEAPSGRLIDEAGCKGARVGPARVSDRHANFILNAGGAAAGDVEALVRRVRGAVRRHSGRELELEVECWGPVDVEPRDEGAC